MIIPLDIVTRPMNTPSQKTLKMENMNSTIPIRLKKMAYFLKDEYLANNTKLIARKAANIIS
jgi:hypothetical protein